MERSRKRRSSILKSNNDQTLRSEITATSRRVSFSRSKNVQEYIVGNPPVESAYAETYTDEISSLRHTEDEDSKALSLPSNIDDDQSYCNKSIIYSPSNEGEPCRNRTLHQSADMDITTFINDTSDVDENDIENLIAQKAKESFDERLKEDSYQSVFQSTRMDMTVYKGHESNESIEDLIQQKAEESFALINSEKGNVLNLGNEITVTESCEMDITKMNKNTPCNKENINLKYRKGAKGKKTLNKTLRQSVDMDFTVLKKNDDTGAKNNFMKSNKENCTLIAGVEMDLTTNECPMSKGTIGDNMHKKSKTITEVIIDKRENVEDGSTNLHANPHKKRCFDEEVRDIKHTKSQNEGNGCKTSVDKTIRQSMDMEFTVTHQEGNFLLKEEENLDGRNSFKKSGKKNCTIVESVGMDLTTDDETSVFITTTKSNMEFCSKQDVTNISKENKSLGGLPKSFLHHKSDQVQDMIKSRCTVDAQNKTGSLSMDEFNIGLQDDLKKIRKGYIESKDIDKENILNKSQNEGNGCKTSIDKTIRQSMDMEFTVTHQKGNFPLKEEENLDGRNSFKKSGKKNCTIVESVGMDLTTDDETSVFITTTKSNMEFCSKQDVTNISKENKSLGGLPKSFLHHKSDQVQDMIKSRCTVDAQNKTGSLSMDEFNIGLQDDLKKIRKGYIESKDIDKENILNKSQNEGNGCKTSIDKTIRQSMDMEFTVTHQKGNFPLKEEENLDGRNSFKKSEKKNCTIVESVGMDLTTDDETSVFITTTKSNMEFCSKQDVTNISKENKSLGGLPESFLHHKSDQVQDMIENELKTSIKNKINRNEKDSEGNELMGVNTKKIKMMHSCSDVSKSFRYTDLEIANSGGNINNEVNCLKEYEGTINLENTFGINEKGREIQKSKQVEENICYANKATCLISDGGNREVSIAPIRDLDDEKINDDHLKSIHPEEVGIEGNPSSKTSKVHEPTQECKIEKDNQCSINARKSKNIHLSDTSLKINSELQEEKQTANTVIVSDLSQSDRSIPLKSMPLTPTTQVLSPLSRNKGVEPRNLSTSSFFENSKSKILRNNDHKLNCRNGNTCSQDISDLNSSANGNTWLPKIETPPLSNQRMFNDIEQVPSNNSSFSEAYQSFRVDISEEATIHEEKSSKPTINVFSYYEKEQLSFKDGYKYSNFQIEHLTDNLVSLSFMEGKFKLDLYIEKLSSIEEREEMFIQHCKINDVKGVVQFTKRDAFVNMVLGLVDTILLQSNMLKGIVRTTKNLKDFLGLIRPHLSSACRMIIAETKIFHSHPGSGLDKKNPKIYNVLFSGFYFYFRMDISFESGLDFIRKSVACSMSEGGCNINFILDLAQKSKESWLFFEDYIKKIDLYVKYMDDLYFKSLDINSN